MVQFHPPRPIKEILIMARIQNTQRQYAKTRVREIEKQKTKEIEAKYPVTEIEELSTYEQAKLISEGKVKLKSGASRMGNWYSLEEMFDFESYFKNEKDKVNSKKRSEALVQLKAAITKANDEIMLGDGAEDLARVLQELSAVEI